MRWDVGSYFSYLLQLLIVVNVLYTLAVGAYSLALGGVIALGLTLVPSVLNRHSEITLPWEINLLIALSLYLHVAGGVWGWYEIFYPYYDKIAHLASGITVSVLGFVIVLLIDRFSHLCLTRLMIVYFIILFTMGLGAIWEIYEFVFDTLFGTNLQHGLDDTMLDLIFDLGAAVFIALIGNFYLLKLSKKGITDLFVKKKEGEKDDEGTFPGECPQ
jgi:hypothetical protein